MTDLRETVRQAVLSPLNDEECNAAIVAVLEGIDTDKAGMQLGRAEKLWRLSSDPMLDDVAIKLNMQLTWDEERAAKQRAKWLIHALIAQHRGGRDAE